MNSENKSKPSPSERAILEINTAANTWVSWAEVLHHGAYVIGDRTLETAANKLSGAAGEGLPRREVARAAKKARYAEMLAEVDRLEAAGVVRGACRKVAEVFAKDADDLVSVDSLDRHLWRLRS